MSKDIKITIDPRKPINERIVEFKVRCQSCDGDNDFVDLKDESVYNVTCPSFLSNGGDGHHILANKKIKTWNGKLDTDVFQEYVKFRDPVIQNLEGRITVITSDNPTSREVVIKASTILTIMSFLFYFF